MAGTLIVALDLSTRADAERLIERLGDAVDFYKIGYQLFYGGEGLALGRALIAACEDWARGRGHKLLTIGVLAKNPGAIRAYEGVGYEPYIVTVRRYL